METHYNSGTRKVRLISDLKNYGTFWYDSGVIADILFLYKAKNELPGRYNSSGKNA